MKGDVNDPTRATSRHADETPSQPRADFGASDLDLLMMSPLDDQRSPMRRGWLYAIPLVLLIAGTVLVMVASGDSDVAVEELATSSPPVTHLTTSIVPLPISPEFRLHEGLAFDADRSAVVMFGGQDARVGWPSDNVWVFDMDDQAWRTGAAGVLPPLRVGHGMIYVDSLDGVLVFGGGNRYALGCAVTLCPQTLLSDLWLYNVAADAWTELRPAGSPDQRFGLAMTYDTGADLVIMFGGAGNDMRRAMDPADLWGETWIYDPANNEWSEVETQSSPPASVFGQMVYDPVNDLVYLWGGMTADGRGLNELWSFDTDTSTWTQVALSNVTAPPGKWMHTMALDTASHSLVVLGGQQRTNTTSNTGTSTGKEVSEEVWLFDLDENRWKLATRFDRPVSSNSSVTTSNGVVTWVGVQLYEFDAATDQWIQIGST